MKKILSFVMCLQIIVSLSLPLYATPIDVLSYSFEVIQQNQDNNLPISGVAMKNLSTGEEIHKSYGEMLTT